jgi:membrane fusion protein, multidrug efflux system
MVLRLDDDAQAVGALQARQGVVIRPETSGRVSRVGFKDGQAVKRGAVLLQIDDTLQQAQLRQALAQSAIARTNLQRQRELVAQNFVSQSAVDQSAAALEVADAQVALARAQIARMRVLAPFDGQVGITSIDPGDYIREGADVVAIDDLSSMTVDFRLAERYVARVKTGQPVQIALDALPGESFAGRVQATDVQIDANGRSLLVRATVDNPQRTLRTGMFARTRIVFATRDKAVMVPEEALVPQGGKQFVIRVVDADKGKVSQRLEAKVGARVDGKVEILEGLTTGDTVVTAGHARLLGRDGVPVRIVDLDRPGGAARPSGPGSPAGPGGAGGAGGAGGQGGQGGQGGADGQRPPNGPASTPPKP